MFAVDIQLALAFSTCYGGIQVVYILYINRKQRRIDLMPSCISLCYDGACKLRFLANISKPLLVCMFLIGKIAKVLMP